MNKCALSATIFCTILLHDLSQSAFAKHENSCARDLDDLAIERSQKGGLPDDFYVLETFSRAEDLCDYGFDAQAQELVANIRSYRLARMNFKGKALQESP